MSSSVFTLPTFGGVDPRESLRRLDGWFGGAPSVAVAFSGGVDSALVAFWARRTLGRERCAAWTGLSPSLKQRDLEVARAFCTHHDIDLKFVTPNELDNPAYAANQPDRCLHCKRALYRSIAEGLQGGLGSTWICSGANVDDMADYRPGLQAARELSIRHPLFECGLEKSSIRALAREMNLSLWDKPASPCLSSRIPYGSEVSRRKLAQIETSESWLFDFGFNECRVRHFGTRAVVEVPQSDIVRLEAIWPMVVSALRRIGFKQVELDQEGLVSGKLNRVLQRDVEHP